MSVGHSAASADEDRRVCLLTGAGGRLGSEFCARYAAEYQIVAVYRRTRPWLAAQDARFVDPLDPQRPIEENGRTVFALQSDLTASGACERVVELALGRFERIDLVVNAAVSSVWAPMVGSDRLVGSAHAQFVTNVLVPLQLSTAAARLFWQSRGEDNRLHRRNIVNVSSVAGFRLYPGAGQSVYAASKAALNLLTSHMAEEFSAIGVRVNAAAPNSFPSIVSTERAATAIKSLDEGTDTGMIVIVDGEKDEMLTLLPYVQGSVEGFVRHTKGPRT